MNFSERLEELLKQKNIKRTAFADDIGIKNQSISDWKKRNTTPAADIVLKIANYLNVSFEYLITGEESKNPNIEQFANLPESELKKYKIIQMNVDDLENYDEQLLLGNYRLLNENNKQVIKQIINNLIQSQTN